jgi:Ala-tRNA(Pro) deacylase
MILKKLREFLDSHNIKYVAMSHSQAFTSEDIAMAAHLPGKELAKTVMVKIDDKMTMTVIPGSDMVSFKLLKRAVGASKIELANETEFKDLFPESEIGAMPPFGNLYNIGVIVAERLAEDEEIAFNSGTHRELIKMSYKDFERLVKPKVMNFSVRKRTPADDHWSYEM